jgi:hypothetical protein
MPFIPLILPDCVLLYPLNRKLIGLTAPLLLTVYSLDGYRLR